MTIAQHGVPTSQAGPVPGPVGAGGPPAPPQGFGWQPAPPQPAPLPVKRGKGLAAAVGAAIVLAAAALVVGIIALVRPAPSAPTSAAAPASSSAHPAGTTEANRAFCTDIAPLMTESDKTAQAFSQPAKNSPEYKAGVPAFVNDTKLGGSDAAGDRQPRRRRPVPAPFDAAFRRRPARPRRRPGSRRWHEWRPYDQTSWNDSLAAGSGPLSACWDLGVKW